ncbi:MAG: hypothetical protein GX089_04900 [Fibrobacter sp.]|jgi:hypothetical protein|nr:hypothetical protein [Fibrobacter sp.]
MKLPLMAVVLPFLISAAVSADSDSTKTLLPRTEFPIILAKISLSYNKQTGAVSRARITFDDTDDQIVISTLDDIYIKNTRHSSEKTTYREPVEKAYYLTEFEGKQINRVCKTFIPTLEQFEKDLKNENWGKCLYLDAFLPRFLRGFNALLYLSKNTPESINKKIRIPEEEFDVSLNSPKSDARINHWRSTPDHVVKLRIATKELIYQIKLWQKRELLNKKRNPEISYSNKLESAFSLFVRIYFNIPPVTYSGIISR